MPGFGYDTNVNFWRCALPKPVNELMADMDDVQMESSSASSDIDSIEKMSFYIYWP
jgi:hypothetical protein